MHIRQLVLATCLLAALPLAARAADLAPQPVEPAAPVFETYSWSGFYAGVNAGYAFGSRHTVRMNETASDDPTYTEPDTYGSLSSKGAFGGGQVGYNAQFGSFVLGLEGDIQGAGINDTASAVGVTSEYYLSTKSKTEWFGTVRPRIGYAFDNILVYATGGVAFGGVKYSQNYVDGPYVTSPSKSDTRVGWAAGAGIEYGITRNWSVKLEYQYVDLGSTTLRGRESEGTFLFPYYINTKLKTDFHTARLGVNYRF